MTRSPSYLFALCSTLLLCAACAEATSEEEVDAISFQSGSQLVVLHQHQTESTDGLDPVVRTEQLPEMPDAGTAPHEPASGYWVPDDAHPESQVFYDTCQTGGSPVPLDRVAYGTEVDAATS